MRSLEGELRAIDDRLAVIRTGFGLDGTHRRMFDVIEMMADEVGFGKPGGIDNRWLGVFVNDDGEGGLRAAPWIRLVATMRLRDKRNVVRRRVRSLTGRYPRGNVLTRREVEERMGDEG